MSTYSSSEQTCKLIINATGKMIIEKGINSISIRAIAKRAGVNIGSIHYHFGSKKNLIKATIAAAVSDKLSVEALEEISMKYNDVLDTNLGKVCFIRDLVLIHMRNLCFCKDFDWQRKLVYQIVQQYNPLQNYVLDKYIKPRVEIIIKMFMKINTEWSFYKAFSVYNQMMSMIIFHFDSRKAILKIMNKNNFPPEYVKEVENTVINCLLNEMHLLPVEKNF